MKKRNAKHVPRQVRCPLTASKPKRVAADRLVASVKENLPAGLSAPALRALAAAGYTTLAKIARVPDAELLKLHGFGPKGIKILRAALAEKKGR